LLREMILRKHYKLKSNGSSIAVGIGPMSFGEGSIAKDEKPKEIKAKTVVRRQTTKKKKVSVK
ncbi:MAG: hypothetical protein ACO3LE_10845, partial [Bdellovibrionota bacterium]